MLRSPLASNGKLLQPDSGRHRQREPEAASLALGARDAHLAVVREHDLARDVEAEPDPLPLRPRHPEELLEDALLVLGRDALAVVLHLEAHGAILCRGAQLDAVPTAAVAERG